MVFVNCDLPAMTWSREACVTFMLFPLRIMPLWKGSLIPSPSHPSFYPWRKSEGEGLVPLITCRDVG